MVDLHMKDLRMGQKIRMACTVRSMYCAHAPCIIVAVKLHELMGHSYQMRALNVASGCRCDGVSAQDYGELLDSVLRESQELDRQQGIFGK